MEENEQKAHAQQSHYEEHEDNDSNSALSGPPIPQNDKDEKDDKNNTVADVSLGTGKDNAEIVENDVLAGSSSARKPTEHYSGDEINRPNLDEETDTFDATKSTRDVKPPAKAVPKLRRTSSSLPLRLVSLPKVSCREKIIFCIDHSDEMFRNKFLSHGSNANPVFKTLVSAVKQFVNTKSYLNKNNQYSLILLNDGAQLITDLSRSFDEVLMMLEDIANMPNSHDYKETDVDKVFDLSNMFKIILDLCGLNDNPKQFVAPPYIVRVVFLYGRSDSRLVFSSGRKSFNDLIQCPQFFLDCVYIHEPPDDNNIVGTIFSSICDLDIGGTSHVYEVGTDRNMACLFNVFAKLLAHPLQRPKQKEKVIEYELKLDSIRFD